MTSRIAIAPCTTAVARVSCRLVFSFEAQRGVDYPFQFAMI
ncbi:hypothetical protein ACZ87_01802, partial [Candidatus Erwinia dacicola]